MCAGNDEFSFLNPSVSSSEDLVISILSNPVTDKMNIKTEGNYLGQLELQLYDMTGSLVWSNKLNKVTPSEYFQSRFQARLDPGIYILTCLYNGKRTLPVKMIVY
jgi:outer membrane protein assembly factor BamB